MTSTNKRWIGCQVSPGMFSDERAVEVGGQAFFVEERVVRNVENGRGEVLVCIIEKEGQKWAVMPTSTRESVQLLA